MDDAIQDGLELPKSALVKVTKMNHLVEVQHMTKSNRTNHIRKLDKERYMDITTGEIKEFQTSENRSENYNSLRQTFKKLRYLINNNFTGAKNELFVTLTYKENMTDSERLYTDFEKFIKKVRYKYKKTSTIDYLTVVEPQERGAWHCHVLLRFNGLEDAFIRNSDLKKIWGHGFVKIISLKNVDNIGAYLSAYLADVELTGANAFKLIEKKDVEVKTVEVDGEEKRFIKGGRLHMYPPGMNLYRKSKGIEMPEREEMTFENAKKVVGSHKPHYSKTYHIENDGFENDITFLQYNTKRND